VTDTYARAHSLGLLTQSVHGPLSMGEIHPVEELVKLEMAWCGFSRRMAEAKVASDEDGMLALDSDSVVPTRLNERASLQTAPTNSISSK
jgi:hypothetical protein